MDILPRCTSESVHFIILIIAIEWIGKKGILGSAIGGHICDCAI